ncbi:MAG TPA: peptide ABC transporter permease [Micrococcales bacterium]|uniref:ABC transporter permease n=1 Tax=Miniimonas arenae TaxID=676201 RepID=UPI000EEA62CB|nr:ABC transporter permease [Miniimonas arenae]HCX84452.1 peptide ABC transporter permease [Micrococcales bacterium]
MTRYLLRRVGQGVFVLWAAWTISFFILYLLPSDPAALIAARGGEADTVDPALLEQLRAQYGLDRPVRVQYVTALLAALRLDFGQSYASGGPAMDVVAGVLPSTIQLAAVALVLGVALGALLAVATVLPRAAWLRQLVSTLPPVGVALPTFWVGLILLQVFSFRLGLFPAMGDDGVASLVLPAVTLAVPVAAGLAQVLSRSLREALGEPYVETARAKGASRLRVQLGHALRNAALPAFTMLGLTVGGLLGGTVVTETVFSRAGLGRLAVTAVNSQDIPVVQAIVVVSALVFVTVTLVVDLVYPLIDPRIAVRAPALAA